jgi:hypothetical protein
MKPWAKSKPFKKWKTDVKSYQAKTKKNNNPDNMCRKSSFCRGSQKIPRRLMPQIYDTKKFSQKIFKRFHIRSKTLKMPTGSLKPSQNEINRKIVKKVVKTLKASPTKGQKPIVVSKDNFVVDGHHRWAAQKVLNPKKKIKVLKMNAPINDALGIAIATETKRDKF